jgi:hypothetical protein
MQLNANLKVRKFYYLVLNLNLYTFRQTDFIIRTVQAIWPKAKRLERNFFWRS